ncbi:hypothetical protein PHISCL_08583 [Aspergillus sclerotialis]|uniref:Uncharacterized protein n=1 Tax=Aspergillus sclerotialis TaxID=2070753 RepID=A0A3A2ZMI0_9EURO|nr:hypothetical protein PHISCL_08583 [Aspergillus sclerotialis]
MHGSVELHRKRYAKSLSLIPVKKSLVFDDGDENDELEGCQARFQEIQEQLKESIVT